MISEIEKWLTDHPGIVGVAVGVIPFLFKQVRAWLGRQFRAFLNWWSADRVEFQKEVLAAINQQHERAENFQTSIKRIEAMAKRADEALFNGGKTGLVQQMQLLTAEANAEFERAPRPMFKCTAEGENLMTNAAYRKLIGLTRETDLSGQRWKMIVYGELADAYRDTFIQCADAEEDFVHPVDFQNPFTGEHRGRWRVIAPAHHVGNGLIYVGELSYALDDKAKQLADEFKFEIQNE